MLTKNILQILIAISPSLVLIYKISHNNHIFDRSRVLYDIFIEILDLNKLYEDDVNPFIYLVIYIIVIFAIEYIGIMGIIPDIFAILLVILLLSLVFFEVTMYSKEPGKIPKEKVKSYKVSYPLYHIYIAFGIGIIFLTLTVSPSITINFPFLSIYFVIGPFLIIAASIYLISLIELVLYHFAREKKFQRLNQYFRDKPEKLKIDILLKNGDRLNGIFSGVYIESLFLRNSEDVIYNIRYNQIEIIGCKFIQVNKE